MTRFLELNKDDKRANLFKNGPNYLKDIDYHKNSYEVSTTTINSGYSDFGPMLYKDKLIFASNRDTGLFRKRVHKWNGQPFLDLYQVDLNKVDVDEGYSHVEKFDAKINTKFHESTPVFTNDGKTIYFTRNNYNKRSYKKDPNGTNRLKIYRSTFIEDEWSDAEELPFNSDVYTTAHPALSVDNKKLYFSSDMPGTLGMSDLWYVTINDDGTYGDPVNLGEDINTEGRESFPFISAKNDLYFASNGHPGLGGLDLFVTTINEKGEVAEIVNLGEPANTSKDDFALVLDTETNVGFLSSNRNNAGVNDDIYLLKEVKKPEPPCDIVLSGTVTDKVTGELLEGATVTLYNTNNEVVATVITDATASYNFAPECDNTYLLRAKKEGYNNIEKIVTTPKKSSQIEELLQLETVQIASGVDIGKILNLNPIYFDFDKDYIRKDAAVELAKILVYMETNPNIHIDIRSHTDSQGDDTYNMQLSQRRNVSTRNWFIAKGIDASRLSGKGYGETQPVNQCTNGVACSEEQYQLNRRSEFIVVDRK